MLVRVLEEPSSVILCHLSFPYAFLSDSGFHQPDLPFNVILGGFLKISRASSQNCGRNQGCLRQAAKGIYCPEPAREILHIPPAPSSGLPVVLGLMEPTPGTFISLKLMPHSGADAVL